MDDTPVAPYNVGGGTLTTRGSRYATQPAEHLRHALPCARRDERSELPRGLDSGEPGAAAAARPAKVHARGSWNLSHGTAPTSPSANAQNAGSDPPRPSAR